jgi:hypothetical protein
MQAEDAGSTRPAPARRARRLVTPGWLALKRLRERPLQTALTALAVGTAALLVGIGSVVAALSQEDVVGFELAELSPAERSIRVTYRVAARSLDRQAEEVAGALDEYAALTEEPRRVRVWNPIAPADERGVRIVEPSPQALAEVSVVAGALPGACDSDRCEVLTLHPGLRPGARVLLESGVVAVVTGRGTLGPRALPDATVLGRRALLVRAVEGPLRAALGRSGSSVHVTAVLRPERVHGYDVTHLAERLRATTVRMERERRLTTVEAPFERLEQLASRARTATDRLLLIAGQGAALLLAFAAFAASVRREDVRSLEEQAQTLGASRGQVALVRAIEALVPTAAGALAALAGLWVAVILLAERRDLPAAWRDLALPSKVALAIAALALVAAAIQVGATSSARRLRFGLGGLEVAALTALAVTVWQVLATGALDPEEVTGRGGAAPMVLLLPALAAFASAVLLLRLLPVLFRLAERAARHGPAALRLAFVSAARNPNQAAAATTLLAVALGTALFGLNYRATLDEQAEDRAAFEAGAEWRVIEGGDFGAFRDPNLPDASPLTRYRAVTSERPTPVLRFPGTVRRPEGSLPVQLLGLPADRLVDVRGWRANFSESTLEETASRVRPRPVRLAGPRVADGATAIRFWVRSRAQADDRFAVASFLLRGQRFEEITLPAVGRRWGPLVARLPESFGGAQIVGLAFPTQISQDELDQGFIDVGGVEQRVGGRWVALASLNLWAAGRVPDLPFGRTVSSDFGRAGHGLGIRYYLDGTFRAFVRPRIELPRALPALVSEEVARAVVDGRLSVDLPVGAALSIEVVGTAELFPTVTESPERFLVLDYDTLFAALNVEYPGEAPPSEAWFFEPQGLTFAERLQRPPFRVRSTLAVERLEQAARDDPLAAGARLVLAITAGIAAFLGLLGLALAVRSTLGAERAVLAEFEALGVPRATLGRSLQARVAVLSILGIGAALVGGALAVFLLSAFVAVTGSAERPLPPIEGVVAWRSGAVLLAFVAGLALVVAATFSRRALERPAGGRLRG